MKDNESLENYFLTDLEYVYVLLKVNELKVKKNLTISIPMIQGWYYEFLKWGWTTKHFNRRYEAVLRHKTFGDRIEIADWLNAEELFSETEMHRKIKDLIQSKITRGKYILANHDKINFNETDINMEDVELAAAYEVERLLEVKKQRVISEYIEGAKGTLLQKISTKRHRLEELTTKQKKFLIKRLIEFKHLDSRINLDFAVKTIKYYAQDITELDIKQAIDLNK